MLGWQAVADLTWEHHFHAYGQASDTPVELAKLTGRDDEVTAAMDHLSGAVLHQGSLWSVTPPATRVVAGLLSQPAVAVGDPPVLTLMLGWLADVAESVGQIEELDDLPEPTEAEWATFYADLVNGDDQTAWESPALWVAWQTAVVDLRAMAAEVGQAVRPWLDDPRESVREPALRAVSAWGALLEGDREELIDAERATLERATSRDERAAALCGLGVLGDDLSALLDDPDPAISACAALFVRTPRATTILVDALSRPQEIDAWFTAQPSYFPLRTRFAFVAEVIERGVDLEQLLPAVVAVIEHGSPFTADFDWGPMLQAAFPHVAFTPGVRPPLPRGLSSAQSAVLHALAANESLWDETNGNATLARMKVGVPERREDLLALLP